MSLSSSALAGTVLPPPPGSATSLMAIMDWETLTPDVLAIIFGKVEGFHGQLAQCRLVCKAWHAAQALSQTRLTVTLGAHTHSPLPLLRSRSHLIRLFIRATI
jgi:hypothetical protein